MTKKEQTAEEWLDLVSYPLDKRDEFLIGQCKKALAMARAEERASLPSWALLEKVQEENYEKGKIETAESILEGILDLYEEKQGQADVCLIENYPSHDLQVEANEILVISKRLARWVKK
jgi:hypothetical protein